MLDILLSWLLGLFPEDEEVTPQRHPFIVGLG